MKKKIVLDGHIKVSDFGLSKELSKEMVALSFCGTPGYIAPEMYRGEPYDYTVDWWPFGVLIYELLTNKSLWYLCEENEDGTWDEDSLRDETLAFNIDFLGCKVSDTSKSILEGLLTQDPADRLGQTVSGRSTSRAVRDIMKHKFFSDIRFSKLEAGKLESPFEPRVS